MKFEIPACLHLHWPDGFVFHPSLLKSTFRAVLLLSIVTVYRLLGTRIVWTIHNLRSHENYHQNLEDWFWKHFFSRLDGWISLSSASASQAAAIPILGKLPNTVIVHGFHPRPEDCHDQQAKEERTGKSLICFGKIRRYKEIPHLLEVYSQLDPPRCELTVAGQCDDPELSRIVEGLAATLPEVRLIQRYVSKQELDGLLNSSSGVVIPYAGSLNSGVVFHALSYGKRVLAPATPTFLELRDDFGSNWLTLFEPPLTKEALEEFAIQLDTTPATCVDPPDKYTWPVIAAEHDKFLREILND
ncbi:MAG: glycosyltransferase [Puniceicoccaceae bacterium]